MNVTQALTRFPPPPPLQPANVLLCNALLPRPTVKLAVSGALDVLTATTLMYCVDWMPAIITSR
jgi:hypothetical protein